MTVGLTHLKCILNFDYLAYSSRKTLFALVRQSIIVLILCFDIHMGAKKMHISLKFHNNRSTETKVMQIL